MPQAHRHGDLRTCGATTIAVGQSTTFVDGMRWAVENDPNSHGGGELIASQGQVFSEGKPVIINSPDSAREDGAQHGNPATAQGSGKTFAGGD